VLGIRARGMEQVIYKGSEKRKEKKNTTFAFLK
jgi:hypothetical protein